MNGGQKYQTTLFPSTVKEKSDSINQTKPLKGHIKELEVCQAELTTLRKENRELQLKFKEFMTQSKLLRTEMKYFYMNQNRVKKKIRH